MQGAGGTRTLSHYGPGRDWVRRCVAVCGRPRSDNIFAPRSTVACTALGPATSDAPASARQDNMPHAKPRPKPLTQASIASASPRLQPEPVFHYEAGREAKARPDDDRSL